MILPPQVHCPNVWIGRFRRRRRQSQILPTYPDQQARPAPRWHIRQTTYVSTDENPWFDSHGNWVPDIMFPRAPQSPVVDGNL